MSIHAASNLMRASSALTSALRRSCQQASNAGGACPCWRSLQGPGGASRGLLWLWRSSDGPWPLQGHSFYVLVLQGQSRRSGSAQTGPGFPKRSFVRPSWMEEDTADSAGASEPVFFSKVGGLGLPGFHGAAL